MPEIKEQRNFSLSVWPFASETATSTGHNTPCRNQTSQSVKNVLACTFEMKE